MGGSQFLCAEPVKILDITSGPQCAVTVNVCTGTRTCADAYTHVHACTHTRLEPRGERPPGCRLEAKSQRGRGTSQLESPKLGFLRCGATGGRGLGAGRGGSEDGAMPGSAWAGNQVLRWGQVEVSRVIIGQTATVWKERGFRKPPVLPPACSPPSPSS